MRACLNELSAKDRAQVERELADLALLRLQALLVRRHLERAARGRPDRSAVRMARRILRSLSEVQP